MKPRVASVRSLSEHLHGGRRAATGCKRRAVISWSVCARRDGEKGEASAEHFAETSEANK